MASYIELSKKRIGPDEPVFVIAEAGVNHNGDEKLALNLIDAAAAAGADAVKFQTFITEQIVTREAPLAEHHEANVHEKISHFHLLKKIELPYDSFACLKKRAEERGLIFISTPYDIESARLLNDIDTPVIKIASAEVSNLLLLETIAEFGRPVILSTGMHSLEDIHRAVSILEKGYKPLGILKCTSNYPVAPENVNLKGIETLKKHFPEHLIGFSDHSEPQEIACAAVALGACMIEKHFTLDRSLWGPDQKASLEPGQFKALVRAIRTVEMALGKADIEPLYSEKSQQVTMRRSICAKHNIPAGKSITLDDLVMLRPSGGMQPSDYKLLIGKKSVMDITAGTQLALEMVK